MVQIYKMRYFYVLKCKKKSKKIKQINEYNKTETDSYREQTSGGQWAEGWGKGKMGVWD